MSPIRPSQPGPMAETARADAARLAAQRAFFAAASGDPAPAQARPSDAPRRPERIPDPASLTEAPQKILRPGSLLDIRV